VTSLHVKEHIWAVSGPQVPQVKGISYVACIVTRRSHFVRLAASLRRIMLLLLLQDVGVDPLCQNPATRIYMTRAAQPWHVDSCDIVGEPWQSVTAKQRALCIHMTGSSCITTSMLPALHTFSGLVICAQHGASLGIVHSQPAWLTQWSIITLHAQQTYPSSAS
jgi:hypothetical protein